MNCHITLYVQNVHRWLTHMLAVTCGSLSDRYQLVSPVKGRPNQLKCILKLGNCFYRAACNADAVLWWDLCLSVCPSVTRVDCDKTEERSVQIFIPYERTFSL